MHREQYDLPDVLGPSHEHAESIDAAAPTSRWGHSVLERRYEVHVVSVELLIRGLTLKLGLHLEGLTLVFCAVLL